MQQMWKADKMQQMKFSIGKKWTASMRITVWQKPQFSYLTHHYYHVMIVWRVSIEYNKQMHLYVYSKAMLNSGQMQNGIELYSG